MMCLLAVAVSTILVDSASARPNFIIFQPDDYRFFEEWTPPAHFPKKPQITTFPADLPWVEKLRTEGLTLERAYTASPACGTSRYSTITGRYPSRSAFGRKRNENAEIAQVTIQKTKLQDLGSVSDGDDCSAGNIAALLSQNEYQTGMVGKWYLSQFKDDEYSYGGLREEVKNCGFTFAEGLFVENLGGDIYGDESFSHNMEWVTAQGVDFISQAVGAGDPFFLYFNPTVPHSSGNVLDAITVYNCTQTPEGVIGAEPDVPYMTAGIGCEAYRQTVLDRANGANENHLLGSIWVDDAIGALMQHLQDLGELDNTFFLFQMDHGQEGKASLYEPGIHMASFVHYPDAFQKGATFEGLTSTIDIAPTVLDFAGLVEAASGYYEMDGESWRDAIGDADAEQTWSKRCVIAELDTDRSVVCGCDKYIQIGNLDDSQTADKAELVGTDILPELLFDICNESGDYLVTPNDSPRGVAQY